MTATSQPISPPAGRDGSVPTVPIFRLTVAQYHAMARAGILSEDDPVELLDGWLVQKMTKNRPHSLVTGLVGEALRRLLPAGWYVDSQEPITMAESEPEPDVIVVRGQRRDYQDRHPGPQDVALVVEVADTSLRDDQSLKKAVYARAGIPVYWIANLVDRQFEVYTEPSGPAERPDYRQCRIYGPSEAIPVALEGVEVGSLTVAELLP